MTIGYAEAAELLDRLARAWEAFDGDAAVACFTEEVELHLDPFAEPLVGHNAVRAYLNETAERQRQVEVTVERHWAVGSSVLASWHASYVRSPARERIRLAGFLVAEVDGTGRIARLRAWWHRRAAATGEGGIGGR